MDSCKEMFISEADDWTQTVISSKDRAQTVTIVAMATGLVALLKQVLDVGTSSKYYYISLPLICACLTLLLAVGIIHIYVSHHLGSMTAMTASQPIRSSLCCPTTQPSTSAPRNSTSSNVEAGDDWSGININAELRLVGDDTLNASTKTCHCRDNAQQLESRILLLRTKWKSKMAAIELKTITEKDEVKHLSDLVLEAKENLTFLEEEGHKDGHEDSFEAAVVEIRNQLEDAEEKRQDVLDHHQKIDALRKQGKYLEELANAVIRKHNLQVIVHWQRVIGYLLYFVLLLILLVAGIGVTTEHKEK